MMGVPGGPPPPGGPCGWGLLLPFFGPPRPRSDEPCWLLRWWWCLGSSVSRLCSRISPIFRSRVAMLRAAAVPPAAILYLSLYLYSGAPAVGGGAAPRGLRSRGRLPDGRRLRHSAAAPPPCPFHSMAGQKNSFSHKYNFLQFNY